MLHPWKFWNYYFLTTPYQHHPKIKLFFHQNKRLNISEWQLCKTYTQFNQIFKTGAHCYDSCAAVSGKESRWERLALLSIRKLVFWSQRFRSWLLVRAGIRVSACWFQVGMGRLILITRITSQSFWTVLSAGTPGTFNTKLKQDGKLVVYQKYHVKLTIICEICSVNVIGIKNEHS